MDRNHKDLTQWFRNYGSLSARRAWIEISKLQRSIDMISSLSARRAWIEIPSIHLLTDRFFVALRKESVDRNLVHIRDRQLGALSLSARRAWIEIRYVDPVPVNYKMSLSARRAWIEISSVWCTCLRAPVALRKESVDRNTALLKSVKSMSRRSPQGERG